MAKRPALPAALSRMIGLVISIGLLVGVGLIGVSLNGKTGKSLEEARRTEGVNGVAASADRLVTGLRNLTGVLSDFADDHRLAMTQDSQADAAVLRELVETSPFYGAGLTTLAGVELVTVASAPLPGRRDPGYAAMVQTAMIPPARVSTRPTAGLLSSVMMADRSPVIAVGLLLVGIDGQVRGSLIGWAALRDAEVRQYLGTTGSSGPLTSLVAFDRAGRVAMAGREDLIGTIDPAMLLVADRTTSIPRQVALAVDGAPGIAFYAGSLPGDWTVIGTARTADFYDGVRDRTVFVNLALVAVILLAATVLIVTTRRADRTVRRQQARFGAMVQNSGDVIAVLAGSGHVLYASPSTASLTGHTGESGQAISMDFVHPDDRPAMGAVFRAAMAAPGVVQRAEFRLRRADGGETWLDASITDLRTSAAGGIVVNARDITDNRRLRERLQEQATVDALTGLGNRRQLYIDLGVALAGDRPPAVLYIDLDRFKPVNDQLGHEAGDELLRLVAARVGNCLRPDDTLARVGGDEFVVVAPGVAPADAERLAARVVALIEQPFALPGDPAVRIGASVGVDVALPGDLPDDVLRRADAAMYRMKQRFTARQ